MGLGIYVIHSAALPGVYLSLCVYVIPALKQGQELEFQGQELATSSNSNSFQIWQLLDWKAFHFWQLQGLASFGKPHNSCQVAKYGNIYSAKHSILATSGFSQFWQTPR